MIDFIAEAVFFLSLFCLFVHHVFDTISQGGRRRGVTKMKKYICRALVGLICVISGCLTLHALLGLNTPPYHLLIGFKYLIELVVAMPLCGISFHMLLGELSRDTK